MLGSVGITGSMDMTLRKAKCTDMQAPYLPTRILVIRL